VEVFGGHFATVRCRRGWGGGALTRLGVASEQGSRSSLEPTAGVRPLIGRGSGSACSASALLLHFFTNCSPFSATTRSLFRPCMLHEALN
jgi:hypothetical protein